MPDQVPAWLGELDPSPASRWVRCALQVNPYSYVRRHGVATSATDEAAHNTALVAALVAAGVELIAVTDHYRIAESGSLLAAARDAGQAGCGRGRPRAVSHACPAGHGQD